MYWLMRFELLCLNIVVIVISSGGSRVIEHVFDYLLSCFITNNSYIYMSNTDMDKDVS